MGCGIEPRKIRYRRGRESLFARRQYVRHRYARCCRPAGVQGHITCKGIASEAGRSRVWPREFIILFGGATVALLAAFALPPGEVIERAVFSCSVEHPRRD